MKYVFMAMGLMFFMTSCSNKLVGTWQISKYESTRANESDISVSNIGTLTFKKNNTGTKAIQYNIFSNDYKDESPFTWQRTEETVTIESEGSQLSKTWIVTDDGNKEQVWKSTDGSKGVQTLRLKKQ